MSLKSSVSTISVPDDYSVGASQQSYMMQWVPSQFLSGTRGTINQYSAYWNDVIIGVQETTGVTSIFEQYDELLRQIKEHSISREEIVFHLSLLLLDFPIEGLEELIEAIQEIHEFHYENSVYQETRSDPTEGESLPISGSYVRPIFTADPDEE